MPVLIPVVCAVIETKKGILCAQRGERMPHPGKWEFPGGKMEPQESPEAALYREIREELGVSILVLDQLPARNHTYADGKTIRLLPFRCTLVPGQEPLAREHAQLRWLAVEALPDLDWVAADIPVWQDYLRRIADAGASADPSIG